MTFGDVSIFVRISSDITSNVKCFYGSRVKQTNKPYKCVYIVSLLLCVFLWPIKCFGDDKYSRYQFTLFLTESSRGGERVLRFFHLVFMLFLFLRGLVKLLLEIHLGKSRLASSWRLWLSSHPLHFYLGVMSSLWKKKQHAGVNHIVPVTIKVALALGKSVQMYFYLYNTSGNLICKINKKKKQI